MKVGRNEPCWCGSGIKYKRCHLDRERQSPLGVEHHLRAARAALREKLCLHPEAPTGCGRRVVRAHTIQKRGSLDLIARQGKVYTFLPAGPVPIPTERLIGIGQASAFNGFCDVHDDVTFARIEKQEYEVGAETAFLLGYRGFCRELYLKRAAESTYGALRRELDRGMRPPFQRAFQKQIAAHLHTTRLTISDLTRHKREADRVLLSRDFGSVRFYALKFDRRPDMAFAGAWFPTHDFAGRQIQDLRTAHRLEILTCALVPEHAGGVAVFVWLGDQRACERFAKSLHAIPDDGVANALVRFSGLCENTYIAPDWWDDLHEETRKSLRSRVAITADPSAGWPCLRPDNRSYAEWGAVSRISSVGSGWNTETTSKRSSRA